MSCSRESFHLLLRRNKEKACANKTRNVPLALILLILNPFNPLDVGEWLKRFYFGRPTITSCGFIRINSVTQQSARNLTSQTCCCYSGVDEVWEEETLIDAHLTPVLIPLSISIMGRVESRYGSDPPLNSLSNIQRGYMRLGRKTPPLPCHF